jgi:nicotinamide-nucleotide amidase
MKPMFKNAVIPFLRERYEREFIKQSVIRTAGVPESALAAKIYDIVHRRRPHGEAEVDFGLLAQPGIVTVRAAVHSKSELLAEETLKRVRKELYDRLGRDIFGEGERTLEESAGSLLVQKKKTVGIAESCTGGLVANLLTNVPGSSLYFKQGIVAYSNQAKIEMLGVDGASLKKFGAVSREVAREMAEGCKRISAVDFALGITGIAGPGGSSPKKPVGLVYIAVATPKETTVQEKHFIGQRGQIKEQAANCAIDMLRRTLLSS